MEKTLKYSIHIYGELEKAVKSPFGTYHVDLEHKVFFFESDDKDIPYHTVVRASEVVAKIDFATDDKSAAAALYIHERCNLLDEEEVQKKDDKFIYGFKIKGEMTKVVETKAGSLYVDKENQVYYFDTANKGFMELFLKKSFCRSINADLDSEDPERQRNAQCIMGILEDWTELDDKDIIREKSCN